MTIPVLRLYVRTDCTLCDEMKEQLKSLQERLGFSFETHDIDRSSELSAKYNDRVPLLMWGRDVICYHKLDRLALAKALGKNLV